MTSWRSLCADIEACLEQPGPFIQALSPYRVISRPGLHHIRALCAYAPRDIIAVYVPEYVVGCWWGQLLHNQSTRRLKLCLLFQPGVMVISVPWRLASADVRGERFSRAGRQ